MKKIYPYIFPGIALFLVLLLAFRWYNLRTKRDGQISQFGEGVEIENLSEQEVESVLKGAEDVKSVNMISEQGYTGDIRYEIKDGKIYFSVTANLPELTEGNYQVWLSSVEGDAYKKAFGLEEGKAGYVGSAALLEENLPFEIVISKEMNYLDEVIEETLLKGVLSK
jgi:hypothetical protein